MSYAVSACHTGFKKFLYLLDFKKCVLLCILWTFARFVHFPGNHQGAHSANKDFLRFRFGVFGNSEISRD